MFGQSLAAMLYKRETPLGMRPEKTAQDILPGLQGKLNGSVHDDGSVVIMVAMD